MVMFIADYDNLRFDFVILFFWNGFGKVLERSGNCLGKIWERSPAVFVIPEIFRLERLKLFGWCRWWLEVWKGLRWKKIGCLIEVSGMGWVARPQNFRSERLFYVGWISCPPDIFEASTRKISRQFGDVMNIFYKWILDLKFRPPEFSGFSGVGFTGSESKIFWWFWWFWRLEIGQFSKLEHLLYLYYNIINRPFHFGAGKTTLS